MKKLVVGKNDLGTARPDLVSQLVDPSWAKKVSHSSHKVLLWKCRKCRQSYEMRVATRTRSKVGCTICTGKVVKKGVNDLRTVNPKLAAELVDKSIATTVTAKSSRVVLWQCRKRHPEWPARIYDRSYGSDCPYCSGRLAIQGENDLATTHPNIARELVDRSLAKVLVAGSRRAVKWRCRNHDEPYVMTPHHRTKLGQGCPFCANRKVLVGFNDLGTTDPQLASELVDRSQATAVTRGTSSKKLLWKCKKSHQWAASPNQRTSSNGRGCPVCHGTVVVAGVNDIATTHPQIAAELADRSVGTRVSAGSNVRVKWKCSKGHLYKTSPEKRTGRKQACPYCCNKRVLIGFNDVATTRPDVAKSFANKSLAKRVTAGSNRRMQFICETCEKRYRSTVARRSYGHGCPSCSLGGFDSTLPGYFYLMERRSEMQIGITNYPGNRISHHARTGKWQLIECIGPYPGNAILELETRVKRWLRRTIGTIAGTTENWKKRDVEVTALDEMLSLAGLTEEDVVSLLQPCRRKQQQQSLSTLSRWSP